MGLKNILLCGALALGITGCSRPVFIKADIKDKRIQKACKTNTCLEDIITNIDTKNCSTLPILKSAHAITARWLSYKPSPPKEKKTALKEGLADCSYYAIFTYSNFLYLADKLKRPELKTNARLCFGKMSKKAEKYHCWLQVNLNNKWENYETTIDNLNKEDEINFRDINYIFPNYRVVGYKSYFLISSMQFKNNKFVHHTIPES